uniref:Uncharacterized protein n=1 Tax=Trypanosoma congolense (strain IL3000) TaxID=1068625 RepID=G0USQ8_TRYCI|nr:hypothetical protein, unlikely [Trypanosoma congolense IL3000]
MHLRCNLFSPAFILFYFVIRTFRLFISALTRGVLQSPFPQSMFRAFFLSFLWLEARFSFLLLSFFSGCSSLSCVLYESFDGVEVVKMRRRHSVHVYLPCFCFQDSCFPYLLPTFSCPTFSSSLPSCCSHH